MSEKSDKSGKSLNLREIDRLMLEGAFEEGRILSRYDELNHELGSIDGIGSRSPYGWRTDPIHHYLQNMAKSAYVEINRILSTMVPIWRRVEDGTPQAGIKVLAYGVNEYGKDRRLRAYYAPRYTIEQSPDDEYESSEYHEESDTYFLQEGWYECNEHEEVNWRVAFEITHWMPLPAAPGKDIKI